MAYDSDYLVDRRRLKRALAFWRVLAVVAALVAVLAAVGRFVGPLGGDHIARLSVDGLIVHDKGRLAAIDRLAADKSVHAVIVHIDSPGGTVIGGESLYDSLRALSEKKPVVAVMNGIATSAAYMTAIAADRIYAREGTLTGSIGVILQTTEISKLLEMIGITARAFKSGELKAVPSPFEPVTPAGAKAAQGLIDEMYAMFRDKVLDRRGMAPGEAHKFADGRVFTGRQAVRSGLVDEIGDEKAALAWLSEARDIGKGLPVRDVKLRNDVGELILRLDGLARKTILSERLTLDGLISVWHPDLR